MAVPSFRYDPPFAAGLNVNGKSSLMPANFKDNTRVQFYFDTSGNISAVTTGVAVQQGSGSPAVTSPSAFGGALYLDTSIGAIWQWGGGSWAVIGSIQSSQGATGAQGAAGAGLTNGPGSAYSVTQDLAFKGPNPWLDVRLYGARPVGVNTTPGAGTTITTAASSVTATLSAASSWQNGDGITIWGAGAAPTMSTPAAPALTASLAAIGTGTGLVVNAPAGGATVYQYQIVARDTHGGLTAASTAVSISNGSTSLGRQSVAITSLSRTANVVTVTTSAPHGLATGALVWINGTSDEANFGGWFTVASSVDNTHFVYNTNIDVRLNSDGKGASATGGIAVWFNCNHIKITPVAGVWQYYIYGRAAGSLTLLGATPPTNSDLAADATYLTWDDFGTTMSVPPSLPAYVPSTPPASATNRNLTTTIASGAGTTTLTLSVAASNSVSGVTPLFDCGPGIVAAATQAMNFDGGGGMICLPSPICSWGNVQEYIINSITALPAVGVVQAGNLRLNDTLIITGCNWRGDFIINVTAETTAAFGFLANTLISVGTAYPGIYGGSIVSGVAIEGASSNGLLYVQDGLHPILMNSSLVQGGYMGMCYLLRFDIGNQSFGGFFEKNVFIGTQEASATTATPAVFFNYGAFIDMNYTFLSGAGIIARLYGSTFKAHWTYRQAGTEPMFTFSGMANVELDHVESDTDSHAVVAFASAAAINLHLSVANGPSGVALITGVPTSGAVHFFDAGTYGYSGVNINVDSIFGNFYSLNLPNFSGEATTASFQNRPLVFQGAPSFNAMWALPSPTNVNASVTSGGSVPVAVTPYQVTAVGYDGGESAVAQTTCTTTSGNQTVTVTWTASPGAQYYNVYRNSSRCVYGTHVTSPYVDTANYTTGISPAGATSSGIVSIGYDSSGNAGIITPRVLLTPVTPPTSTSGGGTVGVLGQIVVGTDGNLYFCSASGAAGAATWNKLNLTAV